MRFKYLLEGIIQEINFKRALISYVLLRAHFETTGETVYFLDRLNSFYNGHIDFERLDEILFSLSLVTVDKNFKRKNKFIPDVESILNMIDKIDKIFLLLNEEENINKLIF